MNRKLLFLLAFVVSSGYIFAETTYKLEEATRKKLVSINLTGATADTAYHGESSSHYGPCIALELANAGNTELNLSLDYGYRLVPDDSSLQTMMVTKTLFAKLLPKQKKSYRVFAMCTEAHDGGPGADSRFALRNRASGNLLALAELINRKNYQSDAAQNAVWCLTNDYDLQTIFSTDTTMMYTLRRFVANAKGLAPGSIYNTGEDMETAMEPVRISRARTTYSGSLSYSFSRSSKVLIALFDENNQMKKVYVNNESQPGGQYTYSYQIGSDEMNDKRHYLRMFRDGRLEDEISIIPHN